MEWAACSFSRAAEQESNEGSPALQGAECCWLGKLPLALRSRAQISLQLPAAWIGCRDYAGRRQIEERHTMVSYTCEVQNKAQIAFCRNRLHNRLGWQGRELEEDGWGQDGQVQLTLQNGYSTGLPAAQGALYPIFWC